MEAMAKEPVIENRRARFNYEILETFEAGLVLQGYEVKSVREGKANLRDGFAVVEEGEVWLHNVHISPYQSKIPFHLDPVRRRKLLLHRHEIKRLTGKVQEKGLTLVPLKLYFKRGYCKLLIGLGRGKRTIDKRRTIMERQAKREIERALKYTMLLLAALLGAACGPSGQETPPTEPVGVYLLNARGELERRETEGKDPLAAATRLLNEGGEGLDSPLPKPGAILAAEKEGELVVVRLDPSALDYRGGARVEELFVGAIVLTYGRLPGVKSVRISVEGKPIDALPEGLEIKEPLTAEQFADLVVEPSS